MTKDNTKVVEMKSQIQELNEKVSEKEIEKNRIKSDFKEKEINYLNKIEQLNATIEIIKEKDISSRDLKKDYENLKSKYLTLQDEINKYEVLKKDYKALKNFVESKNKNAPMPLNVAEKEKITKYESQIKEKDSLIEEKDKTINELKCQLKTLKEEQRNQSEFKLSDLGSISDSKQIPQKDVQEQKTSPFAVIKNYEFDSEIDVFRESKDDLVNRTEEDEKLINELNQKLKEVCEELEACQIEKETISQKCKKESESLRNQYQKEFELISSAMYNLGSNFWNMKFDYEQKLHSNPSWLQRERLKELNGDN